MSKHTPGPWEVSGKVQVSTGKTLYLFENRCAKAGELRANARLIAAAPEMLGVLRAVRNSISSCLAYEIGGPLSFDDVCDSLSDALDAIDATINDATQEGTPTTNP